MDNKRRSFPFYLYITLLSVALVIIVGQVLRAFGDALPGLLPAGRATMKKTVRLQAGRAGANAAGLQSSGTTLSIYRKIAKEYACASRNVPETGETKEDA